MNTDFQRTASSRTRFPRERTRSKLGSPARGLEVLIQEGGDDRDNREPGKHSRRDQTQALVRGPEARIRNANPEEGKPTPDIVCYSISKVMSKVAVFQGRVYPPNYTEAETPASPGGPSRLCYTLRITSRLCLESSSTGSSFPADSAKPVPLAVVSLDSR